MKKWILLLLGLVASRGMLCAQQLTVPSPNGKITVALYSKQTTDDGEWCLHATYNTNGKSSVVIPQIELGLIRSDQEFSKHLKFLKAGKPLLINESYTVPHGKKSVCTNQANEVVATFENPAKEKLQVIIRVYNDGIAFRYEFPEKKGTFTVKDELTAYSIPSGAMRWMEKWNTANEGFYTAMKDDKVLKQEWCYPALFQSEDKSCWFLLHEADVDRQYCGTKLSNTEDPSRYKITFPDPRDGKGLGAATPVITLPWKSPWRVIVMGSLSDIVASTLVDDVSSPSVIKNTGWIKPGVASWNYWSNNHGTRDYKIVCNFTDLAATMNWPYTLFDWEWDAMDNGGHLEDAVKYALSKGVKPLMWYNSGGPHTDVSSTPRDRMLTHESRMAEFAKLKQLGVAGVKIDFFESEKQDMIKYYLDILEDAARAEMMVYFHGCIVPRGWARTYPNLMTHEAVRGAEWYNYGIDFTMAAPEHNAVLPFTRNVVGAMDYTPVTFTNSQFPHITSYGHELALSVLFESGIQHMADRPEGYQDLPDVARSFLKTVPAAWDDTKLLDGYPGQEVIMARRKADTWYIGGISAGQWAKKKTIRFNFLKENTKYRLTLITDGVHDKTFTTQYSVIDNNSTVEVKLLRSGGFAATIVPMP
ncbi:glycoside hydrolase family 97 protein [Chitinophaga varians]|uniref:glycoside hydrolase family 97 protein n=1 Tax=Chitinophaga varians TaxID=2202339 RepID=UPI00166000C1|nr:glycoside hydrolase family 97 protein [Chitinophaga varians]MBC9914550.1 glycoside hydrolase family 97 catalytic domain-containing protein [Chitinophaga varians]